MDPVILAVACGAALGGFVQGVSGFAFALVAVAVWSPLLPPAVVGPLAVFGSLIGQILGAGQIRRGFDLRRALPMLAGGGRRPVVTGEKLRRARELVAKGLSVREAAARLKVGKTALYEAMYGV